MTTTFRIQLMTIEDHANYMNGGNNYTVKTFDVPAETAEKAKAIAKMSFPHLVINDFVESVAEIESREAERLAKVEAAKAKETKAKAKREAAKQRKIAEDLSHGITPEMRKAMTNAKRYATEIRKLEKQLAELKKKKSFWDKIAEG